MKTINGGEEFEHADGDPDHQALVDKLVDQAETTFRIRAAAPFVGDTAIPYEATPPTGDPTNLN